MAHDINILKNEALKKDQEMRLIVDKVETGKKLIEIVKKKRQQLEDLKQTTESLLTASKEEADRLVNEARVEASEINRRSRNDKLVAKILASTTSKP